MVSINNIGLRLLSGSFTGIYEKDGKENLYYFLDQKPNNLIGNFQKIQKFSEGISWLYDQLPEKESFFKKFVSLDISK